MGVVAVCLLLRLVPKELRLRAQKAPSRTTKHANTEPFFDLQQLQKSSDCEKNFFFAYEPPCEKKSMHVLSPPQNHRTEAEPIMGPVATVTHGSDQPFRWDRNCLFKLKWSLESRHSHDGLADPTMILAAEDSSMAFMRFLFLCSLTSFLLESQDHQSNNCISENKSCLCSTLTRHLTQMDIALKTWKPTK